jgi:hypothetical protein
MTLRQRYSDVRNTKADLDLLQVGIVHTSMYSSDRVLNETILGIDEVHAEAGEANPLRKREFRETKIGSTENLNTVRTSRGRALMNFSSAVLNTWIFAKGVSIANCRRKECLAGHVEHCWGRAEKHCYAPSDKMKDWLGESVSH